jgi:hypothetical protein
MLLLITVPVHSVRFPNSSRIAHRQTPQFSTESNLSDRRIVKGVILQNGVDLETDS